MSKFFIQLPDDPWESVDWPEPDTANRILLPVEYLARSIAKLEKDKNKKTFES
jgi:hypothetical protein